MRVRYTAGLVLAFCYLSSSGTAAVALDPPVIRGQQDQPQLTIPKNAPTANTILPVEKDESHAMLEIALPEVFRGCWQGTVEHLDSVDTPGWIHGGEPEWVVQTGWTAKVYELCYKQVGTQWRLAFGDAQSIDQFEVGGPARSLGFHQGGVQYAIETASSDSAGALAVRVKMQVEVHVWFGGSFVHDSITDMRCRFDPAGSLLIDADVHELPRGHDPGWKATWKSEFKRISE